MPLPLLAVPAIMKAAVGVGQAIGGLFKKVKPEDAYAPPELKKQAAEQDVSSRAAKLAGTSEAEAQVKQNQAQAVRDIKESATSSSAILSALASTQSTANKALGNISAQNQQFQQQQREKFYQTNQQIGQIKQNYVAEGQEAKRGLIGSGLQNIMAGASDIVSAKMLTGGDQATTPATTTGTQQTTATTAKKQPWQPNFSMEWMNNPVAQLLLSGQKLPQ